MPQKIFICYRRDDSGIAGRIGDSLAVEFGRDGVFLDTDKLKLGRRFDSELLRTLNESDVFLTVIGSDWLQTLQQRKLSGQIDYVVEEITEALRLKLTVIPMLVDGAKLPDESLLPVEISNTMRWHGHTVRHESFRRDIDELVQAIYAIRGSDKRSGQRSGNVLQRSLLIGFGCAVLVGGGWWFIQERLKASANGSDTAAASIGTDATHEETTTTSSEVDPDEQAQVLTNSASAHVIESAHLLPNAGDSNLSSENLELLPEKTVSSTPADPPAVVKPLEDPPAGVSSELSVSDTSAAGLVDDGEAMAEPLETDDPVATALTAIQAEPVITNDGIEQDDAAAERNDESVVPAENSKPEESLVTDQRWKRLDGVFPNKKFSLCGYDSFTVAPMRNTDELLLLSDDKNIPGQAYPRLRWKIQTEQPVELFEGCSAIFSYNKLAGGERIYMKVKEK